MKKFLMTGAAIMALSTAAGAATFTLSGGTAGSIPAIGETNEVTDAMGVTPVGGYFGAQVSLAGAGLGGETVTVDYFGFEAGYQNSFVFGGSTLFDVQGAAEDTLANNGNDVELPTGLTPLLSTAVGGVTDGLLSFSFVSVQGGSAVNGANPANSPAGPANFFVSMGRGDPGTVYLFFDDTGAGDDDNHDDLVIRLTVSDLPPGPQLVPLPAAGLLLLGALGGLGVAARRRK